MGVLKHLKNMDEEKYEKLKEIIKTADDAYYKDSTSIMTDYEYDTLVKIKEKYENEHKIKVNDTPGSSIDGTLELRKHSRPMLSLQNTYSPDELIKKLSSIAVPDIFIEPKYDGVSLSLIYKDGKLVDAVTRGDGKVGETVLRNAGSIENILTEIPNCDPLIIRGEVVIFKDKFHDLNQAQVEKELPMYSNPRNAASGLLRSKNVDLDYGTLHFLPYFLFGMEEELKTYQASIQLLEEWGFGMDHTGRLLKNVPAVIIQSLRDYEARKDQYPYMIDGLVVKVNNMNVWPTLGNTSKHPKWAFAFKFPPDPVRTILKDIQWTVARTGNLTPVGILEPVDIDGVTISKVTLHNASYILENDYRLGDTVKLIRAAEVIPKLVGVEKDLRYLVNDKPTDLPEVCPCCGKPIKVDHQNIIRLTCTNPYCTDKLKRQVEYIAGRSVLDIKGLGTKILDDLVDAKVIQEREDIFNLYDWIGNDPNVDKVISPKNGEKIKKELRKLDKITDEQIMAYLDIPNLGKSFTNTFLSLVGSWDTLLELADNDKGFRTLLDNVINSLSEVTRMTLDNWLVTNRKLNFQSLRTLIRFMARMKEENKAIKN